MTMFNNRTIGTNEQTIYQAMMIALNSKTRYVFILSDLIKYF